MGTVLELRLKVASDWSSLERGQLLMLAERLPEHLAGDLAFGVTEAGDPWFAVLDCNGDVIVHVARIGGFVVIHALEENQVAEGPDLPAAAACFFGEAEPDRRTIASAPPFVDVLPAHMFAALVEPDADLSDFQARRQTEDAGVFFAPPPLPVFRPTEAAFLMLDEGGLPDWERLSSTQTEAEDAAAGFTPPTPLIPSGDKTFWADARSEAPEWLSQSNADGSAMGAADAGPNFMLAANDDLHESAAAFGLKPQQDDSVSLSLYLSSGRQNAPPPQPAGPGAQTASNDQFNLAGWSGSDQDTGLAPPSLDGGSGSDFQVRTIGQMPDVAQRAAAPDVSDSGDGGTEQFSNGPPADPVVDLMSRLEKRAAELMSHHDNDAPIRLMTDHGHLEAMF